MKKIKKIILLLVLLIIGINKVSAANCEDLVMYAESNFQYGKLYNVKYTYKNSFNESIPYDYSYYTLKDANGSDFSTYCRHAGKSTGVKNRKTLFVCEKKVFDTSLSSNTQNAYDAGILSILENGYSTRNTKTYSNSEIEKMATDIALRSYEMFWDEMNLNTPVSSCGSLKFIYRAQIYFTNQLLRDTEIKNLVKNATGRDKTIINCERNVEKIEFAGQSIKTQVDNRVRELIVGALNAAIDYKNNGAASVTYSNPTSSVLDTKYIEGKENYIKTISYTFNIDKFKNADSRVNLTFDCPDCESQGLKYTFYINNKNVGSSTSYNLLEYVENGSGTVKVKIEFTRDTSLYSCKAIKYDLNLKYFDETIDTEAYSLVSSECPQNKCQHFYMLYSTNNEITDTISDTIEVCDCNELEDLCTNGHTKACTIIDTDYEGECANCKPIVTNAECTKDDAEINILEGYELDEETCETSPKENILRCVIESKDEAGNSYRSDIVDSDYCSVWCKEDYHLTLPGQKETTGGRYFSLKASVSGTKACYTSKIDKELFESDYASAKNEIISAYNTYSSSPTATNASKLDARITAFNNIVKSYNSCSEWNLDYDFDPEVKFWFEEGYMNSVRTDILETTGDINKSQVNVQRCSSDVTDNSYETCTTGWSTSPQIETRNEYLCYKNGDTYECGNKEVSISQTVRMKASMDVLGNYITPTQFYTIYPSGAIAVADKGADIENASPLDNALPVGLGTNVGVYNFTVFVENLGEYYNTDKLGRIWGDSESVVSTVLNDDENTCKDTGALQGNLDLNGKTFEDGVYVCAYKVNCPDCPVECDENGCYWKDCPENDCPVECDENGCYYTHCPDKSCPATCENCIYSNNDSNIDYRPITPDDVNPNDRDLGANWETDGTIDTAMELKAYTTTEEIETYGDTVYDIDYDSDEEEYAMEVTLDSKMISKIREYNDKHEDEGYLNNTLKCYDYVNAVDGDTYENVYCYSTFIDELLYDNDLKDNIKITKERVIGTNPESTDKLRKTNTQASGYWTTWSEANSTNWTITTERILYYKSKYGTNINIGPSWK